MVPSAFLDFNPACQRSENCGFAAARQAYDA